MFFCNKFWEIFDERTELCHKALKSRHNRLLGTSSDVAPILWQYGALARLKKHEKISRLLYDGYSTISLGYAGLYECVKFMTGHSHSDEGVGEEFGLKVMQALNDKCNQWKEEENIDYSLYGTPLESTTYKFAKSLKNRFGKDVFVKIQSAWSARDWKIIRPFESNELFEQHNAQLQEYINNNRINMIERVAVESAELMSHKVDGDKDIVGYGIDNDEDMLEVASVSTELQHLNVKLYHQDAVTALDIPQCDLAISDLPIGYYPLDENAKNYQTRAKEGHSYVHHLLIEQSMNYLKPGAFGVFLVPSSLFQTKESQSFVKWIQSVAYLQGLINLPAELFANPNAQKSILLLQRQGGDSKQAVKVLLGEFPSFKDKAKFASFMDDISKWVTTNLR